MTETYPALLVPDWDALQARAQEMARRAYAPYSNVRVGAAALVSDGRIVAGCNVENASYGLTLCAECSVAAALVSSGGGRLLALAVVGGDGQYLAPCGRCRQVLFEFGGPELLIDTGTAIVTLDHLLPDAFGPADLPARADPAPPPTSEPTGPPRTSFTTSVLAPRICRRGPIWSCSAETRVGPNSLPRSTSAMARICPGTAGWTLSWLTCPAVGRSSAPPAGWALHR